MVRSTLLCFFSSGGPPGSISHFNESVFFYEVFGIFYIDFGVTSTQLFKTFSKSLRASLWANQIQNSTPNCFKQMRTRRTRIFNLAYFLRSWTEALAKNPTWLCFFHLQALSRVASFTVSSWCEALSSASSALVALRAQSQTSTSLYDFWRFFKLSLSILVTQCIPYHVLHGDTHLQNNRRTEILEAQYNKWGECFAPHPSFARQKGCPKYNQK